MAWASIVFLTLYPILWAYRDFLCFPFNPELKDTIHWTGYVLRATSAFFAVAWINPLGLSFVSYISLEMAFYAFYFWTMLDGFINIFSMNGRPFLIGGGNAKTDQAFGSKEPFIKIGGLLISVVTFIFLYLRR